MTCNFSPGDGIYTKGIKTSDPLKSVNQQTLPTLSHTVIKEGSYGTHLGKAKGAHSHKHTKKTLMDTRNTSTQQTNITECFQAYKIQEIACAAAVYFIQFTLHPVNRYSYIRVSLSAKDESPISQHRVPLIHHGSPITQHGHHLHAQQIFLPAWGTLYLAWVTLWPACLAQCLVCVSLASMGHPLPSMLPFTQHGSPFGHHVLPNA